MEQNKAKEKVHIRMDQPMIQKTISIVVCAAMLVGFPVAANSERVKLNAHPHQMSETIVAAEATCTQDGVAYQECQYEGCDYQESVEMLALDHAVEGLSCSRCGTEFEPNFEVIDGQSLVYVYGQPCTEYTGLVTCDGEQWYAKAGVKNTEYQGLYHTDEAVYYLCDGKVQLDYTDYYYENGKKWYVKEGLAYDHYCGEVTFTWPTPDCWIVTSYYGRRNAPVAGASSDHKGIDIGAMPGVKIVAAAAGTVVETGYHDLRGNYLIIKHGDGLKTIYMHCTKVFVSSGQQVSCGEKVATVGSTGNVSGPHLHFGVYLDGTPVNPMFYLPY